MKSLLGITLLSFALSARALGYDALQGPTELLYWNPAKAEGGCTFFGARGTTYLIDMEGKVVHTWPVRTNPHLLDNGNVLDAAANDPSGFGGLKEVDWSGKTVWSYTKKRSSYHLHHDITRIFNPKLNMRTPASALRTRTSRPPSASRRAPIPPPCPPPERSSTPPPIGPTLARYGLSDALQDPTLTVYRGSTALASNDNWPSSPTAAELTATATAVGAFPLPTGRKDAALIITLPAGAYTEAVSGVGNTSGTALVGLYVVR